MISRTRIASTFQSLERLNSQSQTSTRFASDGIQQVRYATSKIQQLVTSQDRQNREVIMKNSSYIEQLLMTLQNISDSCTQQNILCVLNELIGKTEVNKKVSVLVGAGITNTLFHVLVVESRSNPCPIDLLVTIHQLLIRIGPKDRKFCVKARLSQALGVTLHLIRTYIGHAKIVNYLLQVLKLYSANAVNACYLGKNGAVSHLFRILSLYGRKYLNHVRCALDTLALLVRSKSNSARAVGQGGVRVLLNVFSDWHKADSKNRHVNLRKAVLNVLKHLTNLKAGRQALIDADGIRILYTSCQSATKCRELENLIFTSSLIMRKCFPKSHLPLDSLRSPFSFSLPDSDFHVIDDGEGQATVPLTRLTRMLQQLRTGGENGYESSVDNDDDISSEDDAELQKVMCAEDEGAELNRDVPSYSRTWTDLNMYADFFPELTEFDMQLDDDDLDEDLDPALLLITSDPVVRMRQWSGLCNSRSACSLPSMVKSDGPSEIDSLSMSIRDLHFPSRGSNGTLQRSYSQLSNTEMAVYSRSRSLGFFYDLNLPQASAVNLKTGSSIFSLDISPQPSRQVTPSSAHSRQGPSRLIPRGILSPLLIPARHTPEEWVHPKSGERPPAGFSVKPVKDRFEETSGSVTTSTSEDDYNNMFDHTEVYSDIAAQTRSVGRFNKVAYPDLHGHLPSPNKEQLPDKKFGTQRKMIFEDIERFINVDSLLDRVVYDLDAIVAMAGPTYTTDYSNQSNRDKQRVEVPEGRYDHLMFNAQFESGNLRKAVQVRELEYDLILSPDINTNHHHQWFYFEVRNMKADVDYRFNIINCEKLNSQFNFGMKPVMFSVAEAVAGRPYWLRIGSKICYYKNHFMRSAETTGGVKGKSYYTTTFSVTFPHKNDVCYLAYHFPYTYTMLQTHIHRWDNTYNRSQIYFRSQNLCHTLAGNHFPLLTITALPDVSSHASIANLKNRPYIFLTGRVHPGESNASWVMKGTIDFLLSDKLIAQSLRELYIFKVIPMLNPDGVINGNHRCSLVAEDLNRCWLRPCPKLHPTIFHSKGLLQYMFMINKTPLVYCDYHGHSRRKNVFLYGCSRNLSWLSEDSGCSMNAACNVNRIDDGCYKILPRILQHIAPAFSLSGCSYVVEKSKETTARVVVWRQFGIARSYTMESSYCGCDQGIYKNCFLGTRELEEMGSKFGEALYQLMVRHLQRSSSFGSQPAQRLDSPEEALSDTSSFATTSTATAIQICHNKKRRESLARSSSSDDDDLEEDDDASDDDDDDNVLPEEDEAGTAFQ